MILYLQSQEAALNNPRLVCSCHITEPLQNLSGDNPDHSYFERAAWKKRNQHPGKKKEIKKAQSWKLIGTSWTK